MARQPMPELSGPERLSPSARPVDTFVNPGRPTSEIGEAMKALSQFSPTLAAWGERWDAADREQQEAAAEGKIGGMTYEQSRDAVKAGTLHEFQSPWFRAAFEKQHGLRVANEVRRKAEEELASADLTQVDPEEVTARYMAEAQDELPQSKFAEAGFRAGSGDLLAKVRDKVNEQRIQRTVEQRAANYQTNMLGLAERLMEKGTSPENALILFRQAQQEQRDALGLGYQEQDKLMAEVLGTLAQRPGTEGLIEALGKLDRGGAPLSTKLGARFETLKLTAKTRTEEVQRDGLQPLISDYTVSSDKGELDVAGFTKWADANINVLGGSFKASMLIRNQNAIDAAQARAVALAQSNAKETVLDSIAPGLTDLARQGRIAEAQDVTQEVFGKKIELSGKELRELGLSKAAQQIERDGLAQQKSPLQIRQEQIEMYGLNGEVDPLTQSRVSALLNSSISGGDLSPTVMGYLPELHAAYNSSPHMVERIAQNEGDRRFLDAIFVGMDTGLDPAESVKQATWRRDNADKIALPGGKLRSNLIDEVYDHLAKAVRSNKEDLRDGNDFLLSRVIQDRVDYYAAAGATGDDLEKRAAESIRRSHAYFNGHYVDITGTGLPATRTLPVFQEAADALKEVRPGIVGKITWVPLRSGSARFRAVTASGVPIPGTERSWQEMSDLYSKRRTGRLEAKARTMPARRDQREKALEAAGRLAGIPN